MKIVIPGGSGYLGANLSLWLANRGHEVVVLSRREQGANRDVRFVRWDGETMGDWAREIDRARAVINLAGRSVNCRYNARNREEIYESRLRSTRIIGEAIAQAESPPAVWLSSSSATIYRHAEDRPMDEETGEIGHGFSVDVCRRWEAELMNAPAPRTRKVAVRSAMVFGPGSGGVFEAFYRLARLGFGGPLGPGTQFVSWVHVEDFCRAVLWLVEHDELTGPVNVASPNPLPNREFMQILREEAGIRLGLPASKWMLEVGAAVLRTETELLLKSRRVAPAALLASGFSFAFPDWRGAVKDVLARNRLATRLGEDSSR